MDSRTDIKYMVHIGEFNKHFTVQLSDKYVILPSQQPLTVRPSTLAGLREIDELNSWYIVSSIELDACIKDALSNGIGKETIQKWVDNLDDCAWALKDPKFFKNVDVVGPCKSITGGHEDFYASQNPAPEPVGKEHRQVGGSHYGDGIDVFALSLERNHDCLQHSAIKYIDRHKLKNGREDIEKAISVLHRILKEQYSE